MNSRKIICVVGTRPEAIKMAPVILALRDKQGIDTRVLATAQHREMLDNTLALFEIEPDIDLNIMRPDQSLSDLTARVLSRFDAAITQEDPYAVVAQGDTTTVFASALACFYRKILFCHVEAGLRTNDFANPFPEEMNRTFVGKLAELHFAPTERARGNLIKEGVPGSSIFLTGNTVIDAVQWMANQDPEHGFSIEPNKRLILMTCHRRENFGAPLRRIFSAIRQLAELYPDIRIVYPVHPNPNVADLAKSMLSDIANVILSDPLDYPRLVALMKRCYFVLTDSGGLQEEAPALGKPVLVLREETERPEGIDAGTAAIAGNNTDTIVRMCRELLDDPQHYQSMAHAISPYGDGTAAHKIAGILEQYQRKFG